MPFSVWLGIIAALLLILGVLVWKLVLPQQQKNSQLLLDADAHCTLEDIQSQLRDREPCLERKLMTGAAGEAASEDSARVSVLTWNVLADGLASAEALPRVPQSLRSWRFRKLRILEELLLRDADIVCLQEVDHYMDFLRPALRNAGYAGFFMPKPWSRCVATSGSADGCVLMFKEARFDFTELSQLSLKYDGRPSNQVALFARLCLREQHDASGSGYKKRVLVAVTHLKAGEGWDSQRAEQMEQIIAHARRLQADWPHCALIIAGDFNSRVESSVHDLLRSSKPAMLSAHAAVAGREPQWTCWAVRDSGSSALTLDYIYYSEDSWLQPLRALLPMPTKSELDEDRGLPCERVASDHVPIMAEFEVVG